MGKNQIRKQIVGVAEQPYTQCTEVGSYTQCTEVAENTKKPQQNNFYCGFVVVPPGNEFHF